MLAVERSAPVRIAPTRIACARSTPERSAPARFAPLRSASVRFVPERFASERSALRSSALARFGRTRSAPARFGSLGRSHPLQEFQVAVAPLMTCWITTFLGCSLPTTYCLLQHIAYHIGGEAKPSVRSPRSLASAHRHTQVGGL